MCANGGSLRAFRFVCLDDYDCGRALEVVACKANVAWFMWCCYFQLMFSL